MTNDHHQQQVFTMSGAPAGHKGKAWVSTIKEQHNQTRRNNPTHPPNKVKQRNYFNPPSQDWAPCTHGPCMAMSIENYQLKIANWKLQIEKCQLKIANWTLQIKKKCCSEPKAGPGKQKPQDLQPQCPNASSQKNWNPWCNFGGLLIKELFFWLLQVIGKTQYIYIYIYMYIYIYIYTQHIAPSIGEVKSTRKTHLDGPSETVEPASNILGPAISRLHVVGEGCKTWWKFQKTGWWLGIPSGYFNVANRTISIFNG